jgi:hypothetical protein
MSTVNMVFDKQICVDRILLDKPVGQTWKAWQEDAARSIAKFILDQNLMTHHSRYDCERQYTHEAFTVLVARPEMRLP